MATTNPPFTITRLSPAIGAEVTGLDLTHELAPETVTALTDAWHEHIVLLFRGQTLDEDQQLAFAARFGTLVERGRPATRRHESADHDTSVTLVSNIRKDGKAIGSLPDGDMWFHHDTCYTENPCRASFLYAVEVPRTGGNTLFASSYAAYDAVPDELRDRLGACTALHVYDYDRPLNARLDIAGGLDSLRHFSHPVFTTHPKTGRKVLYVNRMMTARINGPDGDGLDAGESARILDRLYDIGEDPAHVYEHVWRPGDLIMWDNYCSMHGRTDFSPSETRLLRRCVIEGERPRA
jgi:taurine dioxygenase